MASFFPSLNFHHSSLITQFFTPIWHHHPKLKISFGFQINGDFGFQMNGGWMGVYTLQTWVNVKMGFDMSLCFIV